MITNKYIPKIPSAFINHADVRFVLDSTIEGFPCEEREAIFFFHVLGKAVTEIAKVTCLSPQHIVSALTLYAERMESRLHFFKKFIPYDDDQLLSAGEILFLDMPV
ncbi:MAG: hypothetical protein FWC71_10955 [Defluviitaleaceae bacterium]|nr:hypothetical protein [Defluviitaleaceae bacterium]